MAKIGSLKSSLFILQSKSINFNFGHFGQNTKAIALLKSLAKIGSLSSLFILQSKSINFNFGHFWAKYQGYSLTFWPKLAHFHHFSFCNQSQSMINFGHFWAKYQGYSLTFWPKLAHWNHHFSFCNQSQSISILVIFGQNTKAIALLFGQNWLIVHHFSFCNQSQSISILVIFGQNTKAIALLFGQNWLIEIITFHSAIKVNQFQFWSFLGKIPRL